MPADGDVDEVGSPSRLCRFQQATSAVDVHGLEVARRGGAVHEVSAPVTVLSSLSPVRKSPTITCPGTDSAADRLRLRIRTL